MGHHNIRTTHMKQIIEISKYAWLDLLRLAEYDRPEQGYARANSVRISDDYDKVPDPHTIEKIIQRFAHSERTPTCEWSTLSYSYEFWAYGITEARRYEQMAYLARFSTFIDAENPLALMGNYYPAHVASRIMRAYRAMRMRETRIGNRMRSTEDHLFYRMLAKYDEAVTATRYEMF